MNTQQEMDSAVWHVLSQVIDPELGCNIVDLGLVYHVQTDAGLVRIRMTLTTPGCPMQESIARGVEMAVLALDDVRDVQVELVWDPPWSPSMMSPLGQSHVGTIDL
jgi:metal-sulfur cluster biosynthetic enzyme